MLCASGLAGLSDDVATVILAVLQQNEAVRAKTHVRQAFNWDTAYHQSYAPVQAEARTWTV
jgi:hypothetical protein